ncbi:MAG: bifunctional 5,10-methylenetetrahydrofolate dehydrogenase/5,10-methenyltetrahydrofolate cyclohydrolase [Candidatus Omnitrophota bacterium]
MSCVGKIIDGRRIAREMSDSVRDKIKELYASSSLRPRLVSLSVGKDEGSDIYINMQSRLASEVGIEYYLRELPGTATHEDILNEIRKLNADSSVTSVIVQKPLPEGICHDRIVAALDPEKDAEGIHPLNLGKILRMEARIVPCTPGAVMKVLTSEKVDLFGKEVIIIGHSAIVGKPLSLMMLNALATTTVCHIGTYERGLIEEHSRRADILIVAVGKANMVKGSWVKKGAVVIDVGINRSEGKIVGDVDISEVSGKASLITPVPGGVGPVTVAILMRNVYRSYCDAVVSAGEKEKK